MISFFKEIKNANQDIVKKVSAFNKSPCMKTTSPFMLGKQNSFVLALKMSLK